MSLKHPLAKVKGMGASGEGSHHWWLQRISALALIPLSLWFLFSVIGHIGDDYQTVINWMSHPCVAVLLILYLGFMFFHAQLGLQVVVEDYLHNEFVKLCILLSIKAIFLVAGVASVFAVLRIAL
jgi:succinate dehydrogenase / fumarate reductase membrane anchor subunit